MNLPMKKLENEISANYSHLKLKVNF